MMCRVRDRRRWGGGTQTEERGWPKNIDSFPGNPRRSGAAAAPPERPWGAQSMKPSGTSHCVTPVFGL